jgi:hypothetical protein
VSAEAGRAEARGLLVWLRRQILTAHHHGLIENCTKDTCVAVTNFLTRDHSACVACDIEAITGETQERHTCEG